MKRLLALTALLAAACARSASRPPPPSALQAVVDGLAAAEPCARVIPSQWTASRPVPALKNGALLYRVFFFGRDGGLEQGFRFHQAEGDAEFTPAGKVLSCARRPRPGSALPASRRAPEPLESVLSREARLSAMTEDAAALYAAGRPLTSDETKRVRDFAAAFAASIEAGQEASYRELSPEFWTWVEAAGGRAPAGS